MEKIKNLDDFIKRINDLKKEDKFDLSSDEDLSLAVMNLVSLEEHFFFSAAKSGDEKYFNLLNEVREIRKEVMKKLEKNPNYEEHCIMKHLLAASMRLMEVGTKKYREQKKEEAKLFFEKSYELYTLFWGINFGLINGKNIKKIEENSLNKHDDDKKNLKEKLKEVVRKAIDCCIE